MKVPALAIMVKKGGPSSEGSPGGEMSEEYKVIGEMMGECYGALKSKDYSKAGHYFCMAFNMACCMDKDD